MSEINVTSTTQRIMVDMPTRSVAVLTAGPAGPTGPPGEVTDAELAVVANRVTALEADTGWVAVPLVNGFTGTLFARRIGKLIELDGLLNASAKTATTAATLVANFRPAQPRYLSCPTTSTASNLLTINTSGTLVTSSVSTTLRISDTYFAA